jgi:aspartate racemase
MKTLGLIGGTSWVSTVDYYKLINQGINEQLGGHNYARCMIYSFNFADIKKNNDVHDWEANFTLAAVACDHLKRSGANGIILCSNLMHMFADRLEQRTNLPVIHIATATIGQIKKNRLKKVGLLGTKPTMEFDFFTSKLSKENIIPIIPNEEDRGFIHASIFEELSKGILKPETKTRYITIINTLVSQGAEGIILGCTEIPLLIQQQDCPVPVFDTTVIHARAAVEFALKDERDSS